MVPRPRNGLSLCAGGAGLDMGLMLAEPGFHSRCYVEWEKYPREVLIGAQRNGYLAPAPIWDDVTTFDGRPLRGHIDTILAGYPCQPFSLAGKRLGEDDERHLWPDVARIIGEVQPRWVFLENVADHVSSGGETVLRDLRDMGFTTATGLFSAGEVGASQKRLRWFTVARRNGRNASAEREQRSGKQRLHAQGRGTCTRADDELGNANACNDTGKLDLGSNRNQTGRGESSNQSVGQTNGERFRVESRSANHTVGCVGQEQCKGEARRRDDGAGRQKERSSSGRRELHGVHLFPPRPHDDDGWFETLSIAPDLAPAVSFGDVKRACDYFAKMVKAGDMAEAEAQRRVHRMADGMAARTRIIHLLGNGVVPLAAAYAWRSLSSAHGLRSLDMGTPNTTRNANGDV